MRLGTQKLALSAALITALIALPVLGAEPSAATKEAATARYNDALDLIEQGNHRGALAKLQEAYALVPTPIIALELGRELVVAGDLIGAHHTLVGIAARPRKDNESQKSLAARVDGAHLALTVEAKIPSIEVIFSAAPAAPVQLTVDGKDEGAAKGRIQVNPGTHKLIAVAGSARGEVTVTIRESQHLVVTVPLKTDAPLTAPQPPTTTTWVGPTLATSGTAPRSRIAPLTYVGFGIAAAGLITGTVTGLVAMSSAATVRAECAGSAVCPASARDDYDASRRMGTISTISFGVAGAGLALGVFTLLRGKPSAEVGAAPRVHLAIGFGQVGAVGEF